MSTMSDTISGMTFPDRGKVKDYLEKKGIKDKFISFMREGKTSQEDIDYFLETPIMTDDFLLSIDKCYEELLALSLQREAVKTTIDITKEGLKAMSDIAKEGVRIFGDAFKKGL